MFPVAPVLAATDLLSSGQSVRWEVVPRMEKVVQASADDTPTSDFFFGTVFLKQKKGCARSLARAVYI